MPITNEKYWNECVDKNDDPYGGACVMVARKAMEILDEEPSDFDTHELICRADRESEAGGITRFMAGCVAEMISVCHSRGDEFRRKWNSDNQIGDEGDKASEKGAVLNPALLTISTK